MKLISSTKKNTFERFDVFEDPRPPVNHKKCSKCGEVKPFDYYHKNKDSKSGFSSWCKSCKTKESKKKWASEKDEIRRKTNKYKFGKRKKELFDQGLKECSKCKEIKSVGEYYHHRGHANGLYPFCKKCQKKDIVKYRENNLDKIKKAQRLWDKENKDKIKEARDKRHKERPDIRRDQKLRYLEKNLSKHKTRCKLGRAVKNKIIIKPEKCSQCNSRGRIEAHHHDYSKPIDVVWLCATCHVKLHRC